MYKWILIIIIMYLLIRFFLDSWLTDAIDFTVATIVHVALILISIPIIKLMVLVETIAKKEEG